MRRHYGQDLPTPGYDAIWAVGTGQPGYTSAVDGAPANTPFYSNLQYTFKQSAIFGEAKFHLSNRWTATVGARGFKFNEDKSIYFGGAFSNHPATPTPVLGSTDSTGLAPRAILTFDATDDVKFSLPASARLPPRRH